MSILWDHIRTDHPGYAHGVVAVFAPQDLKKKIKCFVTDFVIIQEILLL